MKKLKRLGKKYLNRLNSRACGSRYNMLNATDKYYGPIGKMWAVVRIYLARLRWKKKDHPRLKALKDIHADAKRAFIICNGPSLNNTDLTKLKDEITIGTNAIYLNFDNMGFKPTYYIVEDNLVAEDRKKDINRLKGVTKFFALRLAYCLKRDKHTIFLNHNPDYNPWGKMTRELGLKVRFSKNASVVTFGGATVTYTCLQLAYHLGIREVYLIGCDHNFSIPERYKEMDPDENYIIESQEDDINHFANEYFGKGFRWHNPKLHKIEESYKSARIFYEANGGRIFNATIGGRLEVFDRVDFNSLFEVGYENEQFKAYRACYENLLNVVPLDHSGESIQFDGRSSFSDSYQNPKITSYEIEFLIKIKTTDTSYSFTFDRNSPPMPLIVSPLRLYVFPNKRLRIYLHENFDFRFNLPGNGWYLFKLRSDEKNKVTSLYINNALVEEKKSFIPLGNTCSLGKGHQERFWKGELGYVVVNSYNGGNPKAIYDTRGNEEHIRRVSRIKPLDYTGPALEFNGSHFMEGAIENKKEMPYTIDFYIKSETIDADYSFTENSPPMPLIIHPFKVFQTGNSRIRVSLDERFDCSFSFPAKGWYRLRVDVNPRLMKTSLFINNELVEEKDVAVPLGNKYSFGKGFFNRFWKGKLGNIKIFYTTETGKKKTVLSVESRQKQILHPPTNERGGK